MRSTNEEVIELNRMFNYLAPADYRLFMINLKRYWRYISNTDVLRNSIDNLLVKHPNSCEKQKLLLQMNYDAAGITNESEFIAVCIEIIKMLANETENTKKIVLISKRFSSAGGKFEYTKTIISMIITPVNEFLIDQLSSTSKVLALLTRFKQKVEVFKSDDYLSLYTDDTKKGENNLALELYEYLFDKEVEYYIEPKFKVGRTDLIIRDSKTEKLILDVKIFDNKGRGKSYILKGVNQLLTYMKEMNQNLGILLIYEVCEESLVFNLNFAGKLASIEIENRRIYFVCINLCEYEKSASKRGKMKIVEISEEEIKNCA